jgi:hypothetical protein
MNILRTTAALLLATGIAALIVPPTRAAVAECEAELAGKRALATTEIEAKKAALEDWLAKAKAIGPGYTRWQPAYNRRIDCRKEPSGQFQCQAIARPCMIKQVPGQDLVPLPRGPQPR